MQIGPHRLSRQHGLVTGVGKTVSKHETQAHTAYFFETTSQVTKNTRNLVQ